MPRSVAKLALFFVVGMIGGIFADQIFWPYFIEKPLFGHSGLDQRSVYLTEIKETKIEENTALTGAISEVGKSVVGVRSKTASGEVLEGSGIVFTSDGLIVTLASLVPLGSEYSFFIEGKRYSYQILKRDFKDDLALIKIGKDNLSVIDFVDSKKIELGERIFVLGEIFEISETGEISVFPSVNEGVVKSIRDDNLITSIAEDEKMNGSPLFNLKGEVVGLNKVSTNGLIETLPIGIINDFVGL